MEPIPETSEAIEEFGPFALDDDLLVWLRERGEKVRRLVPDCVGLSLSTNDHRVTFTLVATDGELALLDALQYVAGGPCVTAVEDDRVVEFNGDDVLDEQAWQLFASGAAASSVAGTLTLPIRTDDQVTGSVNLYASSPHAFDGQHEAVAEIFGAWAEGAVTNADLGFTTRRTAERAPQQLRGEVHVEVAAGMLAAADEVDLDTARERLRDAALRAGVPEAELARTVIELSRGRGGE